LKAPSDGCAARADHGGVIAHLSSLDLLTVLAVEMIRERR